LLVDIASIYRQIYLSHNADDIQTIRYVLHYRCNANCLTQSP
jgi:hypothetical protein